MTSKKATQSIMKLGTGNRAKDLTRIQSFVSKSIDAQRSRECESQVQAEADVIYLGEHRLQKMLPPFLKWPIWKAQPRYFDTEPKSLTQIKNGLTAAYDDNVSRRVIRLNTMPRISLTATYGRGELGSLDRRHLIALVSNAVKNDSNSEEKNVFKATPKTLAELTCSKLNDRFREPTFRT